MIAGSQISKLKTTIVEHDRRYDIPGLQLRRRSDEHPMAMFGVIVATAFISMFMMPSQNPAQAASGTASIRIEGATTTDRTSRLPETETDRACKGQAWGAESLECLAVIARESGIDDGRRIRLVAAGDIDSTTPNVF